MATVVATVSTSPTLAQVKSDFGKLAELLDRQANTFGPSLSPGITTVLKAIAASTDSTDLRTT